MMLFFDSFEKRYFRKVILKVERMRLQQPVTFDVHNFGRFAGRVGCRHDGEGGQVGHGSNRGRADPGAAEEPGNQVQEAEKDDVPVDAATLLELVHQDEPEQMLRQLWSNLTE